MKPQAVSAEAAEKLIDCINEISRLCVGRSYADGPYAKINFIIEKYAEKVAEDLDSAGHSGILVDDASYYSD